MPSNLIKAITRLLTASWSGIALVSSLVLCPHVLFPLLHGSTTDGLDDSYVDDKIRVQIPDNWSAKSVYRISSGSRFIKYRIGVMLSEGLLDLYLLTHYPQASGIKGGSFSEVSRYVVPWLKDDEPNSCFNIFEMTLLPVSTDLMRVDLTLNPESAKAPNDPVCSAIQEKVSRRVWAGAFFGHLDAGSSLPGFFISMPIGKEGDAGSNDSVFAASVHSSSINALPEMNDPKLIRFLSKIDQVVTAIRYVRIK